MTPGSPARHDQRAAAPGSHEQSTVFDRMHRRGGCPTGRLAQTDAMSQPTLDRTLNLRSVVLFGLAYMAPMIVLGAIAEQTNGAAPSAYLLALAATLFTRTRRTPTCGGPSTPGGFPDRLGHAAGLLLPADGDLAARRDLPTAGLPFGADLFAAIFLAGFVVTQFASGIAAQASVSRSLYAMGRDRVLPPKVFAYLQPRFRTPAVGILICGLAGWPGWRWTWTPLYQ